jgi:hypothetical protein
MGLDEDMDTLKIAAAVKQGVAQENKKWKEKQEADLFQLKDRLDDALRGRGDAVYRKEHSFGIAQGLYRDLEMYFNGRISALEYAINMQDEWYDGGG